MICLYWYIYICPLFYLHYLYISLLVFVIRLSYNLPVYFVLLCNCSVLYCCIFFAFFTTFQLCLLKFSGWQMIGPFRAMDIKCLQKVIQSWWSRKYRLMICLYWYIYICPLFYLHYLYISLLVFFIRLSYNLPVYFVLLCNCSVLSVVSVINKDKKIKYKWFIYFKQTNRSLMKTIT
jgi:hypothetical protein